MIEAYRDFFKRFADFKGKTSVSGYWLVVLDNIIISIIFSALEKVGPISVFVPIISTIYSIVIFIPGLAIVFRRLHDAGRSGWNILWIFIPLLGWLILILCLIHSYDGVPKSLLR